MTPLKPSPSLLSKLGSIVVHAEELIDPIQSHHFDMVALKSVLNDPEVNGLKPCGKWLWFR
jgi:hypothetical protein